MKSDSHRFCVAPMMEWTDRHCRYFLRLISQRTFLYTEMVTAEAVLHGNRERVLGFSPEEHPVGLQLGGSDPRSLAEAARIGAAYGYDEINLNIGCPSDRVQSGRFGACLMAEPDLVAECVAAMGEAVDVPITVKCRIGIDDQDAEESLDRFIDLVAKAGCRTFIVHARKAWLKGLSPKENRDVPPLDYGRVRRLKARRPDLEIVLNGGNRVLLRGAQAHLANVDGVMLGRAAYADPYLLAAVDRNLFGEREACLRGSTCSTASSLMSRLSFPRRPPQSHDAPYPRAVPRTTARARLPAASRRERPSRRRRHRGVDGGAAHRCRRGARRCRIGGASAKTISSCRAPQAYCDPSRARP